MTWVQVTRLKPATSVCLTSWCAKLLMRPDKTSCCTEIGIWLFVLCKFVMPFCMPSYVHYNTVIMLVARSKRGNGNPLLSGHRWCVSNFELVIPSMQVLIIDWFSVGWLMICLLFSAVITIYYRCSVQRCLCCKGVPGVLHITGLNTVISVFESVTLAYVALELCYKLVSFFALIFAVLKCIRDVSYYQWRKWRRNKRICVTMESIVRFRKLQSAEVQKSNFRRIIIIIIMKTSKAPLTEAKRPRTVHACT